MNKELKKILIQQGIDTAGRLAGNYLLNSLTQEGQDDFVGPRQEQETDMQPGQSNQAFREAAKDLTPRYRREDLPSGFGAQTVLGPVVENPSEAAIYARSIAPYAGMAAAGTALNFIFGGKPSSEYKAPVGNRRSDGKVNQNVLASNTKSRNDESLEALKFKHAVNLMNHKAELDEYKTDRESRAKQAAAGNPEFEQYLRIMEVEAADRQGLLGVEKDIARSIFGTGFRA